MIDTAVARLVRYAEQKGLIAPEDHIWAVNTLLEALQLDAYEERGRAGKRLDRLPRFV